MTPCIHLYFKGRKCRKSDESFLATFKEKVAQIKCHKNL